VRTFSRTSQFKKDVKLAGKRGNDLTKLKAVLDLLIDGGHCLRNLKITLCAASSWVAVIATSVRTGFWFTP
jgi:hypothetical protein